VNFARASSSLCLRCQLPWSTSNEDLVELFETTGQVVLAEILYEGTRSKGSGVVQFKEVEEAEQAGQKFTGYVYGGRPLGKLRLPETSVYSEQSLISLGHHPRRAIQRQVAPLHRDSGSGVHRDCSLNLLQSILYDCRPDIHRSHPFVWDETWSCRTYLQSIYNLRSLRCFQLTTTTISQNCRP